MIFDYLLRCEEVRELLPPIVLGGARPALHVGVWDAGIGRRGDALRTARSPRPPISASSLQSRGHRRVLEKPNSFRYLLTHR